MSCWDWISSGERALAAGNLNEFRRCLENAQREARGSIAFRECARLWHLHLNDGERSDACLVEAETCHQQEARHDRRRRRCETATARPPTTTANAIRYAKFWMDHLGQVNFARRYLRDAERMADDVAQKLACADAWGSLLGDVPSAQRCRHAAVYQEFKHEIDGRQSLQAAQIAAKNETELVECANNWVKFFNAYTSARICLKQAEKRTRDGSQWIDCKLSANANRSGGSGQVFFYPGCYDDWFPLYDHHFECCDTFIYCDYGMELEDFEGRIGLESEANAVDRMRRIEALQKLPQSLVVEGIQPLDQFFVDCLSKPIAISPGELGYGGNLDGEAYYGADADHGRGHPYVVKPWGRRVFLSCHRSTPPRPLELWYFGIGGAKLYANLFTAKRWAPDYLCIKCDGMGFGNGVMDFADWQKPLGRMVDRNLRKPTYIVGTGSTPHYNWPWNVLWQEVEAWEGSVAGRVPIYRRPHIDPGTSSRPNNYGAKTSRRKARAAEGHADIGGEAQAELNLTPRDAAQR